MSYQIKEETYGICGDGYFVGTPAVFLRFADDEEEAKTDGCRSMSPSELIEAVKSHPSRHIVVSGRRLAEQFDSLLIDLLHDEGFFIQAETSGTQILPEGIDWVTCVPEVGATDEVCLRQIDELRVVYTGQDVDSTAGRIPAMHYFVQPEYCSDGSSNVAETLEFVLSHPYWRLSIPLKNRY